ncbi:NADH:flavin oxidoreductase [Tritonibacter mobilis]|uniref:NADH:flavin oxidoreductase n=1 Tax=Tritonibacter mobilis TaxID=379347 RepID=UPI003A5BF344
MTDHHQTALSPVPLAGRTLKNRLAVAPMTRVTASDDGNATEMMARYYERFAIGGFGLVITEGIYTDRAHSQGYLNQPGLTDDGQANAWKPVVKGIQRHGAAAFAQLMHAGGISQGNRFRHFNVAPSATQPKGEQMAFYRGEGRYPVPQEISVEQIDEAIDGFASAAVRAVDLSGFDGIEIHGANGYLLDQFLTSYTNSRDDKYGGPIANRIRMTLEVISAVRAAVGSKVPLGVRISQGKVNDFHHKWEGGEKDAEVVFGSLADSGVDYIHVTEFEAWKPAFGSGLSLAQYAKKFAPNTTILANGSLHDAERAEQVLNSGIDLVTLGRGALANPDFPMRYAQSIAQRDFNPSILGPLANIKETELEM